MFALATRPARLKSGQPPAPPGAFALTIASPGDLLVSRNKNRKQQHATKLADGKKMYIGLARVSSREQEREGFSLDTQEQEIRRYVEKAGGELVRLWRGAETATRAGERATFRRS